MSDDQSPGQKAPWEGQPYSVKRHGVTITNCDSEPIQTPGCIQAHGALLVLRPTDLTILQASENTGELLGRRPEELLGQPASAAIGIQGQARLRETLAREPCDRNPLYVATLPPRGDTTSLDMTVHTIDGVAVVEFEATGRGDARPETDYYALVKKTVGRLQWAPTLQQFCDMVTEEVRALTGLDRVMVYKFHPSPDGGRQRRRGHKLGVASPGLGAHDSHRP